jgi:hypothetical protein
VLAFVAASLISRSLSRALQVKVPTSAQVFRLLLTIDKAMESWATQ